MTGYLVRLDHPVIPPNCARGKGDYRCRAYGGMLCYGRDSGESGGRTRGWGRSARGRKDTSATRLKASLEAFAMHHRQRASQPHVS